MDMACTDKSPRSPIDVPLPPPFEPATGSDRMAGSDRVLNCYGGREAQRSGTAIEIQNNNALFEALCSYATEHGAPHSFRGTKAPGAKAKDGGSHVEVKLGFGEVDLAWEGYTFLLTHASFGKPHWAGGRFSTLVLSSVEEGEAVKDSMSRLAKKALTEHETAKPSHVTLYSFSAKQGYWTKDREIKKRQLESVILPEKERSTVVDDARNFLGEDAKAWYGKHGIPYKRTYCLHGPPGCGKSSLISAVASEFDLNVCMLSLADPDLKDQGLRAAMQHIPKRSVIVFEDVDAIFNHHREKQESSCVVTFSGLLNALDGVGEPCGTLFFLTTNHLNRLDKALIRPGRVDVQVKVDYASDLQVGRMLTRFYEEATHAERSAFVGAVRATEIGKRVSMAQLQEHFVQHRLSPIYRAVKDIRLGAASHQETSEGSMWS